MIVVGIDIGVSGAIAVLSDGALVEVHDMPTLNDGPASRRAVNAPLLAEILAKSHADKVLIESVNALPTDGRVGAFAFGRSRGVCEGVCAALGLPVVFITSPSWKRLLNIPPGKDGTKNLARSKAIARWPNRADLFKLAKHDGRAEACLIAVAGTMLEAR
jgi:crossover junction endodeoxyribonuclease RuvC